MPPPAPSPRRVAFEAQVLPGLGPFALRELRALPGARVPDPPAGAEACDAIPFEAPAGTRGLHALRTVTAVQRRIPFDVPRPKALLGDAQLRRLLQELRDVLAATPEPMHGFRLRAAGRDSPVFQRLAAALADGLELPHDDAEGGMQLRVRRAGRGWEVLARLTPRPLSARTWRVRNRAGGLNACVAAACVALLGPRASDRYLNAMCGTGTLLVERAQVAGARRLVGVDVDPAALDDASANLRAAGVAAELRREDALALPDPPGSFDALAADLPWGDAVGDAEEVARLHPGFLREARRVAADGARMVLVSHALTVLGRALAEETGWREVARHRVFHGGHRPALVLLRAR